MSSFELDSKNKWKLIDRRKLFYSVDQKLASAEPPSTSQLLNNVDVKAIKIIKINTGVNY